MRPLLPRNLFLFLPHSSSLARAFLLQISHFSGSSNSPSHFPSYSRRQDEESRNVRVAVWWDFENCHLPAGVNVFRIAHAITEAVRANGIKGPIQITAFGDVLQLSRANQEAMSSTGINLTHIPNGGKNSADRSLLVDLMYWVSQNPPPAHLFLISGDRDFAGILHRLRMSNYNILLASPERAPNVLCSAATIMWHWSSLVKGENLAGKRYNYPPDGPYGSWYGHHKVPLEDPFLASEQSTSSQSEEISETTTDTKLRPVPKAIVKRIQNILNSYPKGLSLSDLRAELAKTDVILDKDYYGHKKFSRLLLSMPQIVQIRVGPDSQFCVRSTSQKYPETIDCSVVPSTSVVNGREWDPLATSKLNGEEKNLTQDADDLPSMIPYHEQSGENIPQKVERPASQGKSVGGEDIPQKVEQPTLQGKSIGEFVDGKSFPSSPEIHARQPPPNEVQHPSPVVEKAMELDVANTQVTENQLPPINKEEISRTKVGFFKRTWRKLTGNEIFGSENVTPNILGKDSRSGDYSAEQSNGMIEKNGFSVDRTIKSEAEDKYEKPTKKEADAGCQIPGSSPIDESVVKRKASESSEIHSDNSIETRGFFCWIGSWWPFWKQGRKSDELNTNQIKMIDHSEEPESPKLDQAVSHIKKPELFSSSSFWSDVKSFLFTSKGSVLVSQSKSREDMARNLQKNGPLSLGSLSENNLLQLVDLLISEKKWLEECPSQTLPFKLAQPVGRSSMLGQSHGANGLRSIFLSSTSQANSQKLSDVEKRSQTIPHTGVLPSANKRKHTERSRGDVLADCQKLVNEILRKHPEGFNMGTFRKLFLQRYGYSLDIHKLGHQKLVSLLQTMPGVKIESTYIIPADHAVCDFVRETPVDNTWGTNASLTGSNSDSELSDSAKKDDNIDSAWEELGPVSVNIDVESKLNMKTLELKTAKAPDYEPCLSDDDLSESEGDNSYFAQSERHEKPKTDEKESSLLHILDSWYSNKEGDDKAKKLDNVKSTCDDLTDILNPSSPGTSAGTIKQKRKLQKSFSFVTDTDLHGKDGLVIDGSKRSNELKIQN
ncbi:hypothetical protein L6164_012293 [Bauhinia variegata]|uniref:Uncharacterized protein n=1 Tax=Bauhinia variegata TaxID=167791 RepID=A0ACB9P9M1_BAUVA|nr:hypothetical protein L6164_012293 [Bauhinia variegata]